MQVYGGALLMKKYINFIVINMLIIFFSCLMIVPPVIEVNKFEGNYIRIKLPESNNIKDSLSDKCDENYYRVTFLEKKGGYRALRYGILLSAELIEKQGACRPECSLSRFVPKSGIYKYFVPGCEYSIMINAGVNSYKILLVKPGEQSIKTYYIRNAILKENGIIKVDFNPNDNLRMNYKVEHN